MNIVAYQHYGNLRWEHHVFLKVSAWVRTAFFIFAVVFALPVLCADRNDLANAKHIVKTESATSVRSAKQQQKRQGKSKRHPVKIKTNKYTVDGRHHPKMSALDVSNTPAFGMSDTSDKQSLDILHLSAGIDLAKNYYSPYTEIYKHYTHPDIFLRPRDAATDYLTKSFSGNVFNSVPTTKESRSESSSDSGVAFDYREKYPHTSFNERELAAFYIRKLDKSWKTQTYVSRGFFSGIAEWRGGLAVGYDY